MPDPKYAGYYPLRSHHVRGRSALSVRCECGHVQIVYLWSWAGHGKARCGGCQKWWRYGGQKVNDGK